jgi:predicted nucleotidyltransferase component of viral defense system
MKREAPFNTAVSVAARLLQISQKTGENHQVLLTRYGLERLMYRLGRSDFANRFVVKGAMLFLVWRDVPRRMTRDLDLLATRRSSADSMRAMFISLCRMGVEDDGILFDESSVTVEEIREDQQYGGLRVTMQGRLGRIRLPIQVDIGFGDAVTPAPIPKPFPALLEFPPPVLRIYPRETVVAEKVEAMVHLGLVNSRLKDYYDIWVLMNGFEFDGELLKRAVVATFTRRKTDFPLTVPPGLSDTYAGDRQKQLQWAAFLRRTHVNFPQAVNLETLVGQERAFLLPVLFAAAKQEPLAGSWPKGGPWHLAP